MTPTGRLMVILPGKLVGNTKRCRLVAQYGTAQQPVVTRYDDAGRMIELRTYWAKGATISDNPINRTDFDRTLWTYHAATGFQTAKTYHDGNTDTSQYDSLNRIALETKASGLTSAYTYAPP